MQRYLCSTGADETLHGEKLHIATHVRSSGACTVNRTGELSQDPLVGCRSCRRAPALSRIRRIRQPRPPRRTRAPSQWTCWVDLCRASSPETGPARSFAAVKKREKRERLSLTLALSLSLSLCLLLTVLCGTLGLAGCQDPRFEVHSCTEDLPGLAPTVTAVTLAIILLSGRCQMLPGQAGGPTD